MLERDVREPDREEVFDEAENPVGEGLGARVGDGAGPGLRDVRSHGDRSAEKGRETLHGRRGIPEDRDGHERSANRANHRVHRVPCGIDPRDSCRQ